VFLEDENICYKMVSTLCIYVMPIVRNRVEVRIYTRFSETGLALKGLKRKKEIALNQLKHLYNWF